MRRRDAALFAAYVGALAFCFVVLLVDRFGVAVPFWDEWTDLRFWAAYGDGTLTWRDVVAQHNEHRITVARLIFLALHRLVGEWNMVTQMLASALLIGLTVAVTVYALRRLRIAAAIGLLAGLLLSSPLQWDNILMGYQVQAFASMFGVTLALSVVAVDDALRWRTVALAVVGCLISSFSFGGGLCSWPAAGAALLVRALLIAGSPRTLVRRGGLLARLLVFALAALAGVAAYFTDYRFGGDALRAPEWSTWLSYWGRVLSMPLLDGTTPAAAILFAVVLWGSVAAAMLGYARRRRRPVARGRLVLFSGWVVFLIVDAALIASSRGAMPYVPPRYATMCLGASVLWVVAAADLARWSRTQVARVALVGVVAALLLVHTDRYLAGLSIMREQRINRAAAREALAFHLRDHSAGLPLVGFATYPPATVKRGDLGRPELVAVLPAELQPAVSGPPVRTSGDAWLVGGGFEGTVGEAPPMYWGTWRLSGAAGTGEIRIGPLTVREPLWRIPIAGSIGPDALAVVDVADGGRRLTYDGPPPGDAWAEWVADLSTFVGRQVELVGIDDLTAHPGWLAVGRPRPLSHALFLIEEGMRHAGLALQLLVLTGVAALCVAPRSSARGVDEGRAHHLD